MSCHRHTVCQAKEFKDPLCEEKAAILSHGKDTILTYFVGVKHWSKGQKND